MAKKKSILGKLLALTTTVAAIGGVCYIFRDKIAESPVFKSASDKASDICDSVKSKFKSDDDFLFDDDWDDDFDDDFDIDTDISNEREYTSLTSAKESADDVLADDSIPTINFDDSNKETVSGYENEGLSDTSEDPDVLEDQDKLDF